MNATYQRMASVAYDANPPKEIGEYQLVASTPTIKIYLYNNRAVVAVRGTATQEDLVADASAIQSQLASSSRVLRDVDFMTNFRNAFPQYNYIGVGHSLGGAILDIFLDKNLIDYAVSFNALVEPHNMSANPKHHRIYNEDDFLYKLYGYRIPNVEVRKAKNNIWKYLSSPLFDLYNLYMGHKI